MLLTSDLSGPSETQRMLQIPLVVIDWVYARIALSVAQASGLELDGYLSIYNIWDRTSDFKATSYILFSSWCSWPFIFKRSCSINHRNPRNRFISPSSPSVAPLSFL